MKFSTHEERMQHSQAKLIPQTIWDRFFLKDLPNSLISLMQANEEYLLLDHLKAIPLPSSKSEILCLWLGIAFSHPEFNLESLQRIGDMLGMSDELMFYAAVLWSDENYFKDLMTKYSTSSLQEMIAADNYLAFRLAAENGHLSVLQFLAEKAPEKLQEMITAHYYSAFISAAKNGHLSVLQFLAEKSPEKLQEMIATQDYAAFIFAAVNDHLSVLQYLAEKAPEKLQEMIAAGNYFTFRCAAQNGHLFILQFLAEKSPEKLQEMIAAENYLAFIYATENNHLSVLQYLAEKAPEKLQEMIAADNYLAFRLAAKKGHLSVLRYLSEKAPEKLQEMIAADNYLAFILAAVNGHLSILQYLSEKAPEKLHEMIGAPFYSAFMFAAEKGHLSVLLYLAEKASEKLQEMIAAEDYLAFRCAAQNGHLFVLQYLAEKAPEKLHEMIAARDYAAFMFAAEKGHLSVLQYLVEKAPEKLHEMIAADNYLAFRLAAEKGHLSVLRYLAEKAPGTFQDMVAADDHAALHWASLKKHKPVINYLLSQASALAYAEQHHHEYGRYVTPFVAKKLADLQVQKNTIEQENAYAVFDITSPEEAKLLFYVLRNLIRQNDPARRDDILLLISIPSVKALAHTEVTLHQPNELLRLALSLGNETAAELLLGIPAVRELAAQNNFYRMEQQGGLDLHALAQNRESAMTALTKGEQQRLKRAITHYQSMLKQAGASLIMEELYAMLAQQYEHNPATITIEHQGKQTAITLPLNWEALQALHLDESTYQDALRAYYQHKAHSAWRYLSKPNPWMHEHASYVYVNPDNTQERWSTFEEYQSLISMLYLAVIDKTMPCLDHHTFESRLEHFIDELALIGRAHNWDKTRIIVDTGENQVTEEFDDLEGDRPSCFSGVKRRLFQSVLGHPFFILLTEDIIKQEIREFIRQHFKDSIHDTNRDAIKIAWEKGILLEERANEDWDALKAIDISHEKLDAFIHSLKNKYGKEQIVSFMPYIQNKFALNKDKEYERAHFLKFGYLQLEEFLEANSQQKDENQSSSQGLNQFGLFAPAEPSTPDQNIQQCHMVNSNEIN
ncbi:ankyrin repeat domain-containing protein [Legionella bozemanae]|uniref:ankyrin repeat domain-containing protein n=1 Tax=Legionella bozemanae TaxID=447 RepID=UPI00399CA632